LYKLGFFSRLSVKKFFFTPSCNIINHTVEYVLKFLNIWTTDDYTCVISKKYWDSMSTYEIGQIIYVNKKQ